MTEATVATRIGTYDIVRRLTEEPRVLVLEAYCTRTARRVWLRVLKGEHVKDARARTLFHREARALLQLVHPNIVSVVDYSGKDTDTPFLATEHLEGKDLATLIAERGAIEPLVHAAIFAQAARGLHAAHAEGLVHRGVAPENVFVCDSGRVVLTGFGSVGAANKEDDTHASAHTAVIAMGAFSAPEVVRGMPADAKSDLFSLGATMLHALSGGSGERTGDAQDRDLLALAARLRSTEPKDRPATAEEAASALAAIVAKSRTDVEAVVAAWLDPKAAPRAARGSGIIAAGDARTAFLAATKGRYELMDVIGEGGMGKVYRAVDKKLSRDVAVKMILGNVDDSLRRRFHREARAMGKVHHPNVVEVLDYSGQDTELPYLVLEYIDGVVLAKELDRVAGAETIALAMTLEIARALACVHGEGFVHRDVKPDNIFVERQGRVLLADFGIVRRAPMQGSESQTFRDIGSKFGSGTASIGSPYYASPEQLFDPDNAGPASDLFSLGSLIIALLLGGRPIEASTVPECLSKLEALEFRPLPPNTSADVRDLIESLHVKDPKKRPASASDVAATIEAMLAKRRIVDTKAEVRRVLSGESTTRRELPKPGQAAVAAAVPSPSPRANATTQLMPGRAELNQTTGRLPNLGSKWAIPVLIASLVLLAAVVTVAIKHKLFAKPPPPVAAKPPEPAPPTPEVAPPPPLQEALPQPSAPTVPEAPKPAPKNTKSPAKRR